MVYGCAHHGGPAGQANRPARVIALALAVAAAASSPAAAQPGLQLAASAAPAQLMLGRPLTVNGSATDAGHPAVGVALALQSDPYPFGGFVTVAHTTSGADGSFAFTRLRPDRNTRVRIIAEGSPGAVSGELRVIVDPIVTIHASRRGPGETHLSLRISHAVEVGTKPVSAFWYTAPRGTSLFRLAAITPTRELSPGVTYASAAVDPPARRFLYRVCLNPAWEHAMGTPASHGRCPRHDFKLSRGAP
jgi:hypothetical protein